MFATSSSVTALSGLNSVLSSLLFTAEQEKSYKTASNYKSAIEGSSPVIYHNGRYVKIKSILLQFSDKQKSDLSYINSAFSKEIALKLREALVFGNIDALDIPATITDFSNYLRKIKSLPFLVCVTFIFFRVKA